MKRFGFCILMVVLWQLLVPLCASLHAQDDSEHVSDSTKNKCDAKLPHENGLRPLLSDFGIPARVVTTPQTRVFRSIMLQEHAATPASRRKFLVFAESREAYLVGGNNGTDNRPSIAGWIRKDECCRWDTNQGMAVINKHEKKLEVRVWPKREDVNATDKPHFVRVLPPGTRTEILACNKWGVVSQWSVVGLPQADCAFLEAKVCEAPWRFVDGTDKSASVEVVEPVLQTPGWYDWRSYGECVQPVLLCKRRRIADLADTLCSWLSQYRERKADIAGLILQMQIGHSLDSLPDTATAFSQALPFGLDFYNRRIPASEKLVMEDTAMVMLLRERLNRFMVLLLTDKLFGDEEEAWIPLDYLFGWHVLLSVNREAVSKR